MKILITFITFITLSAVYFIGEKKESFKKNDKKEISQSVEKGPSENLAPYQKIETQKFLSLEDRLHELRLLKSPKEVQDFIDDLDKEIKVDKMVIKLNNGTASDDERKIFGEYLKIRSESYKMIIDAELASLEAEYL